MRDSDEDRTIQKRELQERVRHLQTEMADLRAQLDDRTQLEQARRAFQRAADSGDPDLALRAQKLIAEMEAVNGELSSKLEAASTEAARATRALAAM